MCGDLKIDRDRDDQAFGVYGGNSITKNFRDVKQNSKRAVKNSRRSVGKKPVHPVLSSRHSLQRKFCLPPRTRSANRVIICCSSGGVHRAGTSWRRQRCDWKAKSG